MTSSPTLNFDTDWSYDPAPESTGHAHLDEQYGLFIGGRFVEPQSGQTFDTISPSTEQKLASVAEANEADIDAAGAACHRRWRDGG